MPKPDNKPPLKARPSDTVPLTEHVHILPVKAREEALSLFAEDGKISEDDLAKLDRVLDFVSDYFCHCYSVVGDGEQGP